MLPCEALEKAERPFWRTVTSAISCSVQESTTDTPRTSGGRRHRWRRVAIYIVAISPMLQGCTARNTPTSDHFLMGPGFTLTNRPPQRDITRMRLASVAGTVPPLDPGSSGG